jgi:hypothetical protein
MTLFTFYVGEAVVQIAQSSFLDDKQRQKTTSIFSIFRISYLT